MDAIQLDVIVRVSAATVLLSLAAMLGRAGLQGRLFVGLAVCLTGFLAGNTPEPALRLAGMAGEMARIASGFAAVFIWWFCLACFDRTALPFGPLPTEPTPLGSLWARDAGWKHGLGAAHVVLFGGAEVGELQLPRGWSLREVPFAPET